MKPAHANAGNWRDEVLRENAGQNFHLTASHVATKAVVTSTGPPVGRTDVWARQGTSPRLTYADRSYADCSRATASDNFTNLSALLHVG